MGKLDDIDRLNRAIKDAETKIASREKNIEAFTKEIEVLEGKESTLEYNLKCLKKSRIVAIAQEFKKSKEELAKLRSNLVVIKNNKEHYIKSIEDMKDFIRKSEKELDKIRVKADNNVIKFSRGKNGQE